MSETSSLSESRAQFKSTIDAGTDRNFPSVILQQSCGTGSQRDESPGAEEDFLYLNATPRDVHYPTSFNEKKVTGFETLKDSGKISNDASLEILQVFFNEFLGITPKPSSSDYSEELKALRRRFFGLTKAPPPETKTSPNNRFDYEHKYPRDRPGEETEGNARIWLTYLDEAETFDREKVDGWKETVDVLLVFAALFSGVITTFISQTSLVTLQKDNTAVTASLLSEITQVLRAQFNGISINSVPNSTLTPTSPFTPSTNAFWVNGLWFTSLAITLSAALFAVLAKQWLHYYLSAIPGTAKEKTRARQLRFQGFELWKVGAIIGLLPILLHLAVGMFLAGIGVLLFPLDIKVAWTMVILTGITYFLYFISVILPIVYPECPYTSSLTIYTGVLFFFLRGIARWISLVSKKVFRYSEWKYQLRNTLSTFKSVLNRFLQSIRAVLWQYFYSIVPHASLYALADHMHAFTAGFKRLGSIEKFPKFTNWREENIKKAVKDATSLDFEALHWLHATSFNTSVRRIIARCISAHTDISQQFEPDVIRNLGQTLKVNEANVTDLRYALCLDLLADECEHWYLLRSMPNATEPTQPEEIEHTNYSRILQDVISNEYHQILEDASRDDTLKFPLAMWHCIFKNAAVENTVVVRILTSEPNGLFEWSFNPAHKLTYNTDVVSFKDPKLGRWKFAYLLRYFSPGHSNPDYSSERKSFETYYHLLVSIYRNFTADSPRPLIADKTQRQKALHHLFDTFCDWLYFSDQPISPEQSLTFFADIFCVDAFWSEALTDWTRHRIAGCLGSVWSLMDADEAKHFLFMECRDLTPLYQWCSRSLHPNLTSSTTFIFALLLMPQNRTYLYTTLSNDSDAVSHFSRCFQNLRSCYSFRSARKYLFPNLVDLFRSVDPKAPLFNVFYSWSVILQVWKFLAFKEPYLRSFLLVLKSKLDQQKLFELHATMNEQAQSDVVREALELSAYEFGEIIGAVSQLRPEPTDSEQLAPEHVADNSNLDHDIEERAEVSDVKKSKGFGSVIERMKKAFEFVWPKAAFTLVNSDVDMTDLN